MRFLDIELYTADPAGTRAFYTQQLGLPIVAESSDYLTLQVGWTRLTFRAVTESVAPYHLAINVPSGTLEVCMHWYQLDYIDTQAPGQTIAEFPSWRARSTYFYDNNGNLLEFIARNDLSLDSPNLTLGDLFQCISEIGIATECVSETARQLIQRFGIGPFAKSVQLPDFMAMGDDNGLLILSKVGRNWLFTDTPAALNYCRIKFERTPGCQLQTLLGYDINQMPIGYQVPNRPKPYTLSAL
ncbi:VOC family protein [Spirosoma taeanense]|uniref:VOC family protein n=1 Tax=Spirosoma taeanense TaxID=2735870 RepID=A0A6M5Y0M3_9BACT|nr:VOC family protein [Spirosoma taeanense]QJW88317.1 VOC family protein [Spirosoma taeanense]